jgi:heptosyltransferase-2
MKTVVYHFGALGDFLAILPAVKAWQLAHPRDAMILLGKPSYGVLAVHSGYFNETWDVEPPAWAWLFSPDANIPSDAFDRFSEVTSAILFTATDSTIVERMKALGVGVVHVHPPFPRERGSIFNHHLSLFPQWTYLLDEFGPSIRSMEEFTAAALELLDGKNKVVAVHPGSGGAKKNWPFDNFIKVIKRLKHHGYEVLWLSGPAEEGMQVPQGCLSARNIALPIVIALLNRCLAYIGNDSGIAHLAAACGCPSVVLFGPSDVCVWKPYGPHVRAITAPKGCLPCHGLPRGNKECVSGCMRISVDEVFEAFEKVKR